MNSEQPCMSSCVGTMFCKSSSWVWKIIILLNGTLLIACELFISCTQYPLYHGNFDSGQYLCNY